MNKAIHFIIIALLLSLCYQSSTANKTDLKSILSAKEIKRLETAEKLITKGDAFVNDTKELEKEVEQLKNADGRIKTGKINKRNKKIAQIKAKAALYYRDGYKRYIDVLDDHLREIDKSGNSEAKQTRKDIKDLEKKARKQYKKAENLSSPEKTIELLELAQKNQEEAIELQTKCLISLSEHTESEPLLATEEIATVDSSMVEPINAEPILAMQDTTTAIIALNVETPVVTEAELVSATTPVALTITPAAVDAALITQIATPVVIEPEAPAVIEEPRVVNPDIFLTIQIMADKKKASEEQITSVYSGNKEVIEMNINDWYKYSIGKYQTLDEAKTDMKTENIKGFIVAYNKNERISVKEAVTLLNGES